MEEALALARELGNKRELAVVLNELAQLYRVEGSPTLAEPLYDQVLSLTRELNDRESIAIALLNLAMVAIARRLGDRAREMLKEAAAIAVEIGSRPVGQSLLEVSAGLAVWRGENELAARFFGAAEIQMEETGLFRHPADQAFLGPLIAQARLALPTAAFQVAEAAGRALPPEKAMEAVRNWLGME